MIILFNIKKLARKLADNSLRETHKLFYFLVPIVFYQIAHTKTFAESFSEGYGAYRNAVPFAITATGINVLVFISGLLWVWLVNRQGDQKNFIERFICLSFPIQVWLQIVGVALTTVLFLKSGMDHAWTMSISLLLYSLLHILHFLILGHWIKKVSHRTVS